MEPDRLPPDVQPIVDWIIGGAKGAAADPALLLGAFCERMLAAGVPLDRVAVFVRPLHPNVGARAFYWRESDRNVTVNEEGHSFIGTEEHLASPITYVRRTREPVRRRLCDPGVPADFPVLEELRAEGVTDYLIMPLEFIDGDVHAVSFSTRHKGGFTDAEIAALWRVQPAFTRVIEIVALTRKAGNILDAYLGRHSGSKVLEGRIRRGDTETLRAVIWFCDLRESTSLAEAIGAPAFLATLNDYFDAVLDPVTEHGGEVLSFIGDAALAIFPIRDDPGEAARHAVDAAVAAIARMRTLNERRSASALPPLGFGIGLHAGEFVYGNVGTRDRITFTVIGPAANEAARIESLCKTLGASPLVSAHVARHVPVAWKSLGLHTLRGVGQPIELFTL